MVQIGAAFKGPPNLGCVSDHIADHIADQKLIPVLPSAAFFSSVELHIFPFRSSRYRSYRERGKAMKIQEAIWSQYAELGKNALKAKQLDLAEKMYTAAVEEAQRGRGDLVRLAESWFGLAQTHHSRQQAVLAIYYYKKAMGVYEKDSGKFGSQLAATWDNLAEIAMLQNELPRAYSFLKKSIALYEKLFGMNSEVLSPRLLRMGYVYTQFKEFDKALACYARAKSLSKPKHLSAPSPSAGTASASVGAGSKVNYSNTSVNTVVVAHPVAATGGIG